MSGPSSGSYVTVKGADAFYRLSKELKRTGKTGLRKELNQELKKAAQPIIPLTRAAALRRLPQSGGLAGIVAKTPQRVQVRTGERTAGVRIVVGKSNSGARAANRGVVRHPTFGKEPWVSQPVLPGWFDDTAKAQAPPVRKRLTVAMETVATKIVKGTRG